MKSLKKLSLLLLTCTFLASSVSAQDNDRVKEVEKGVFQIELTDEQVENYYQKIGEPLPDLKEKSYVGKIIQEMNEIKTEEFDDQDGNKHVVTYYHVKYKDTKEAQHIQEKIKQYKQKYSEEKNTTLGDIGAESLPTEGDIRIERVYEQLIVGSKFDYSTKNYLSAFAGEYYQKQLETLSSFVISNPIAGYFTGQVLNDLKSSLQGKGDATSYYRLVHKLGQVYHYGTWKTYYDTYQREWYWKHDQISYNKDNTVKSSNTFWYWPEGGGNYLPIDWTYTSDFYNNTRIQEVAQYQYSTNPNASTPTRDFIRYENYRSDWKATGTMPY